MPLQVYGSKYHVYCSYQCYSISEQQTNYETSSPVGGRMVNRTT
jgi:hypothetical protein